MANAAYARGPAPQPGVVIWFKVYCAVLCTLYLLVSAASVVLLFVKPDPPEDPALPIVLGLILFVVSIGLFVLCLIPIVAPPRSWVWLYGLIVICVGLSSCFLPACIPLLIWWIKPETKNYYGA